MKRLYTALVNWLRRRCALWGAATIFHLRRTATWRVRACDVTFVKGAINDALTERTYVTPNDAGGHPRILNVATGNPSLDRWEKAIARRMELDIRAAADERRVRILRLNAIADVSLEEFAREISESTAFLDLQKSLNEPWTARVVRWVRAFPMPQWRKPTELKENKS